ncbi:hypothetical protein [Microcoleus sp. herbarium12]
MNNCFEDRAPASDFSSLLNSSKLAVDRDRDRECTDLLPTFERSALR